MSNYPVVTPETMLNQLLIQYLAGVACYFHGRSGIGKSETLIHCANDPNLIWSDSAKLAMRKLYKDGDWVFGIGPHRGCSPVFENEQGVLYPFEYLDDYNPDHFRLATPEEIEEAKRAES